MKNIRCRLPHLAGQQVSADSGQLYRVDPVTMTFAVEDEKDIAGFLAAGFAEVKGPVRPVIPPPPPVPQPPIMGGGAAAEAAPDAADESKAPPPALSHLPPLPSPHAEMQDAEWTQVRDLHTTQDWLREANSAGVILSPEQQATKPKLELVKFIYKLAHAG